jgi:hypothetical protein
MRCALLSSLLLFTTLATASERDSIKLSSTKHEDVRSYTTSFTQEIKAPIETVRASIVNFAEKCDQRLSRNCKYHWPNLVEVKVQTELLYAPRAPGEVHRYVVQKRGYDRVSFQYQELVREFERDGQYIIEVSMLNDKNATQWMTSPLQTDYPFSERHAVYQLVKTPRGTTQVNYQLTSKTAHWLISREILVPQTLESMVQETLGIKRSLDPKDRSVASSQK